MDRKQLASKIDNTLLKPIVTIDRIEDFCIESRNYGFSSVCIQPCFVKLAAEKLAGSPVKVCTVIGFPLGANTTHVKLQEAVLALTEGAVELDMVINIGLLKSHSFLSVENEIRSIVDTAAGKVVKVIIETCFLDYQEKLDACKIAINAGAAYIKTSTGYGTGGATLEDIKLIKEIVQGHAKIKASGNINTLGQALAMLQAGADLIGSSSGISILNELNRI